MIAIGALGAIVGGLIGLVATPSMPEPISTIAAPEVPHDELIPVHVSGWVAAPGVVWIPAGSLASVAIDAAGGALPGARLDSINLARQVADGEQVHVPGPSDASAPGMSGDGGLVDINAADETDLQILPGVGPVLAARIVAHREEFGRFEAVEDLLDVPGIGEAKLASIRDLIKPP
ncbi:MAG: ComEA family DNA-binding protein [Actinobacteria bacterium]|nr:MAG: ComEA family DNA-binding protein [Actinomycetota bacterium]